MAKKYFTEQEAKQLIWDCEIEAEYGDNRRWSRSVTSIVEDVDGKCYAIDWEEGLTESQENEYYAGTYPQVEKKTYDKTITVTEWVAVE
jgi:hypothetical protein